MFHEVLKLEERLRPLGRAVVGFSGGVDSALLAFACRRVLGRENVRAVTGDSASLPAKDRNFVAGYCRRHDIPHHFLPTREMENPEYRKNPENRCYYCKEELYLRLRRFADGVAIRHVLDGTNATDLEGHRPGFEALKRAGVIAPFVDLGFSKETVRRLAAHYGLEAASKPQSACLASRIPTGTAIDAAVLEKIDRAEETLKEMGIAEPRVRYHGAVVRLELKREEWNRCVAMAENIQGALKPLGFQYVTLDLKPYARRG